MVAGMWNQKSEGLYGGPLLLLKLLLLRLLVAVADCQWLLTLQSLLQLYAAPVAC